MRTAVETRRTSGFWLGGREGYGNGRAGAPRSQGRSNVSRADRRSAGSAGSTNVGLRKPVAKMQRAFGGGGLMPWTIWRAQAAPTSLRVQRAYRLTSAGRKSLQFGCRVESLAMQALSVSRDS